MSDLPNPDVWVRRLVGAAGGVDDVAERVGLHRATLYQMLKGKRVGRATVVKFARGMQADVNEGLRVFGYEPEAEPAITPEQALNVLSDADLGDPDDPEVMAMVEYLREHPQRSSDGRPERITDKDLLMAATLMIRRRRKREADQGLS